jgi:hypothetical protein
MQDRFVISSEIEVDPRSPNPSSDIVSDPNQRLRTAAALIDLLRDAGLDCQLVASGSDDPAQMTRWAADASLRRKTAKTALQ